MGKYSRGGSGTVNSATGASNRRLLHRSWANGGRNRGGGCLGRRRQRQRCRSHDAPQRRVLEAAPRVQAAPLIRLGALGSRWGGGPEHHRNCRFGDRWLWRRRLHRDGRLVELEVGGGLEVRGDGACNRYRCRHGIKRKWRFWRRGEQHQRRHGPLRSKGGARGGTPARFTRC